MLQIIGEVNNLSRQLINSVPKLERDDKVIYELVGGVIDPLTKEENFGTAERIPMRETIYDPFQKKPVEICVFVKEKATNNHVPTKATKKFQFGRSGGGQINKRFVLYGNNVDDIEAHYFLYLSSMREDNPYRDSRIKARYRYFDEEKEAKVFHAINDKKFDAQLRARQMSMADLKEFALAKGWNVGVGDGVLKRKVIEYASNPDTYEDFLETVSDPDLKLKSDVSMALDMGLVLWDPIASSFKGRDGKAFATVRVVEGKTSIDLLSEWIRTTAEGPRYINNLRKQIQYRIKSKAEVSAGVDDDDAD